MEYTLIKQPIIKLKEIDPSNFGLPKEFEMPNLTSQQEWTMNALKSLDKAQGIKGKSEEEWFMNLNNFF
jgi:hypothetical protein